jgi:hypothetical protein
MLNMFERLSDRNKGLVLLSVGVLLLLNVLGINWFRPIIGACAVYLILLGLVKLEAHKQLMNLMNKKNK